MRPVSCPVEDDLGTLLELPTGDPRRQHIESCPRCRGLALAYGLFLDPPRDLDAERAADEVTTRLDALREDLIAPGAPPTPASTARESRSAGEESWWRRLLAPPLRPAWALAAVAVISVVAVVSLRDGQRTEPNVVRGSAGGPMELAAPEILGDGGVRLAWRPAAEPVDGYEVALFSARLEPLARIPAGRETVLTIPAGDLPAAYRAGDLLFYRVEAMAGGDPAARSESGSFQKPGR